MAVVLDMPILKAFQCMLFDAEKQNHFDGAKMYLTSAIEMVMSVSNSCQSCQLITSRVFYCHKHEWTVSSSTDVTLQVEIL